MNKRHLPYYLAAAIFLAALAIELAFGRPVFGPEGRFAWWTADIWSAACSQRVADPYSFSHIIHGMAFFAFLWLVARRLPVGWRFTLAVLFEAGWELLENSPLIIDRYRHATMALGYNGDSILNSMSDILMMSLGFLAAARLPVWVTVTLVLVMEIGCALWIRDNLTLNVIMLIHPVEAIKVWQMGAMPVTP